jgi:hypothetical protein
MTLTINRNGTRLVIAHGGTQGPAGAGSGATCASYAAINAMTARPATGSTVLVRGYAAPGDGGDGTFYYEQNSARAVDGGTVLAGYSGSDVWVRLDRQGDEFDVCWFGAKNDNASDSQAGIDAAIAGAAAVASALRKPILLFPSGPGFRTSGVHVVPPNIHVQQLSPLTYTGTGEVALLTIGTAGSTNYRLRHIINVVRATQSDWTNEANIGCVLLNNHTSNIDIEQASNFTIGVQGIGSGTGFVYNNVTPRFMVSNKVGFDLTNETHGGIGWCNDNRVYGGEFSVSSGVNRGLSRYGMRFGSKDGSNPGVDNNRVYGPSFELNRANMTAGVSVGLQFQYGLSNYVYDLRAENTLYPVEFQNDARANVVKVGYLGNGAIDAPLQSGVTGNNTYVSIAGRQSEAFTRLIYKSASIPATATPYNATDMMVPGLAFWRSGSVGAADLHTTVTSLTSTYLELGSSRAIGFMLDTSLAKQFVVNVDAETGHGGRVLIHCFDGPNGTGNTLDSSGANQPYVKGNSASNILAVAGFATSPGQVYLTQSDTAGPVLFSVGADVQSIWLGLRGGSATLQLHAFSVWGLIGAPSPAVVPGYSGTARTDRVATQAPASGTWSRGDRVYHDAPVLGGNVGWECLTAGTPGTWVTFGDVGIPFSVQIGLVAGNALVATNVAPPGFQAPMAATLTDLVLLADTAPTGAALTVAVKRTGATLATVSIADGATAGSLTGQTIALAANDLLTFDVTQVGATVAGANIAIRLAGA